MPMLPILAAAALSAVPAWRSGAAIAVHQGKVYVADRDRGDVAVFDAATPDAPPLERIAVGENPAQLVAGLDGTVFVTVRGGNRVVALRPDGSSDHVELEGEPFGLARDDAGERLFVTLATAAAVVCLDPATLKVLWRRAVPEHPRPILWTRTGVLVGHLREGRISVLDARGNLRAPIHLETAEQQAAGQRVTQTWALLPAKNGEALAVFRRIDTAAPLEQQEYYGNAPMQLLVAAIGDEAPRFRWERTIDGALLATGPTAAALIDRTLLVSAPGSDGLFAMDLDQPAPVALKVLGGFSAVAAAPDGSAAYGLTASARGVQRFTLQPKPVAAAFASLGPSGLPKVVEAGRRLFHRGNPAGISCASCHVEGMDDGLAWQREGARRQTPALAGRLADTAPYGWEGKQSTLEGYVKHTLVRLNHPQVRDADVATLSVYIRDYLEAPSRPAPSDTALVARGESVFNSKKTGCSSCHDADTGFSDGARHDVGTHDLDTHAGATLETPSLRLLSLTGPYLHDGSASSLEQLLALTDGKMGQTGKLSADEKDALLAYLQSL